LTEQIMADQNHLAVVSSQGPTPCQGPGHYWLTNWMIPHASTVTLLHSIRLRLCITKGLKGLCSSGPPSGWQLQTASETEKWHLFM